MILFPIIYILVFVYSLRDVLQHQLQGFVSFIIFGLSIYTVTLSVTYMLGYAAVLPALQVCKEFIALYTLGYSIYHLQKKMSWHSTDKLVIAFFVLTFLYVFLPLGSYSLSQKIVAFKSLSFFPVIYFAGRIINTRKIYISKSLHYILILSVLSTLVLLYEVIRYTHLQTQTGYAEYAYHFFEQPVEGSYGLSWTFEIEGGIKRFASFFANPLEHATATLVAISAIAALITTDRNTIRFNRFTILALGCTVFSIVFALSRASFASYFILVYVYAFIAGFKQITKAFHIAAIVAAAAVLFFTIKGDLFEFILNTIQFKNTSSAGHLLVWLDGIDAIIQHPLGLGLGEAGRISAFTGYNTGGENQFIIIGVQTGVAAMLLYIFIYAKLMQAAFQLFRHSKGKTKKLGLFILMIKVGLFIPLMTAEVESYTYITYITWFFSGLLMNYVQQQKPITTHA